MIISTIILIIGSSLLGISKAIADTVQHIDIWSQSIFSAALETSFWGPKDKTWKRKDHKNKIINWLLHYPLVWVTDVWHCANTVNSFSIILLLVSVYYTDIHLLIIISLFYTINSISFNLFYHLILKKNAKK